MKVPAMRGFMTQKGREKVGKSQRNKDQQREWPCIGIRRAKWRGRLVKSDLCPCPHQRSRGNRISDRSHKPWAGHSLQDSEKMQNLLLKKRLWMI